MHSGEVRVGGPTFKGGGLLRVGGPAFNGGGPTFKGGGLLRVGGPAFNGGEPTSKGSGPTTFKGCKSHTPAKIAARIYSSIGVLKRQASS